MAGEYAASSMGLGFARMIDFTNSGQGATVGQFLSLVFLVIFLSVDGHLLSIAILMETYKTYGIGDTFNIASFAQSSLNAGSQLFVIAALMALPIVGGIFLVNIALGILTKVAPQMNLFSVGFPATILVGFFLLWPGPGHPHSARRAMCQAPTGCNSPSLLRGSRRGTCPELSER